jgi:hypothetical protein
MPHFKVILSGSGIDCAVGNDRAVGFFTTRLVKAPDLDSAESVAKELILSEWRPGGEYSTSNRGSVPVLAVEESFPLGFLAGIFSRRPSGYSFYRHED